MRAVSQRTDGSDVRDEDVARLSPFVRHHISMLGRYSFHLPKMPGGLRPLRDPDAIADRGAPELGARFDAHGRAGTARVSGVGVVHGP
ncbi:hypothetical protein ACFZCY_08690 [Streptomyces sp. NPDC007983]|uniref:hypothetical protein n=1 Tax=Streptomyces sp. NPDC007983 TaxID=3364800 RepID=UPI0036ED2F83